MRGIFCTAIIISVIWIQTSSGFNCLLRECTKEENEWSCFEEMKGEDKTGCHEKFRKINGKETYYNRDTIENWEGYEDSDKKFKEGCVTTKYKMYGQDYEDDNCFCFKDFCNKKYKIPDGAKKLYYP